METNSLTGVGFVLNPEEGEDRNPIYLWAEGPIDPESLLTAKLAAAGGQPESMATALAWNKLGHEKQSTLASWLRLRGSLIALDGLSSSLTGQTPELIITSGPADSQLALVSVHVEGCIIGFISPSVTNSSILPSLLSVVMDHIHWIHGPSPISVSEELPEDVAADLDGAFAWMATYATSPKTPTALVGSFVSKAVLPVPLTSRIEDALSAMAVVPRGGSIMLGAALALQSTLITSTGLSSSTVQAIMRGSAMEGLSSRSESSPEVVISRTVPSGLTVLWIAQGPWILALALTQQHSPTPVYDPVFLGDSRAALGALRADGVLDTTIRALAAVARLPPAPPSSGPTVLAAIGRRWLGIHLSLSSGKAFVYPSSNASSISEGAELSFIHGPFLTTAARLQVLLRACTQSRAQARQESELFSRPEALPKYGAHVLTGPEPGPRDAAAGGAGGALNDSSMGLNVSLDSSFGGNISHSSGPGAAAALSKSHLILRPSSARPFSVRPSSARPSSAGAASSNPQADLNTSLNSTSSARSRYGRFLPSASPAPPESLSQAAGWPAANRNGAATVVRGGDSTAWEGSSSDLAASGFASMSELSVRLYIPLGHDGHPGSEVTPEPAPITASDVLKSSNRRRASTSAARGPVPTARRGSFEGTRSRSNSRSRPSTPALPHTRSTRAASLPTRARSASATTGRRPELRRRSATPVRLEDEAEVATATVVAAAASGDETTSVTSKRRWWRSRSASTGRSDPKWAGPRTLALDPDLGFGLEEDAHARARAKSAGSVRSASGSDVLHVPGGTGKGVLSPVQLPSTPLKGKDAKRAARAAALAVASKTGFAEPLDYWVVARKDPESGDEWYVAHHASLPPQALELCMKLSLIRS